MPRLPTIPGQSSSTTKMMSSFPWVSKQKYGFSVLQWSATDNVSYIDTIPVTVNLFFPVIRLKILKSDISNQGSDLVCFPGVWIRVCLDTHSLLVLDLDTPFQFLSGSRLIL